MAATQLSRVELLHEALLKRLSLLALREAPVRIRQTRKLVVENVTQSKACWTGPRHLWLGRTQLC